MRPPCCALCDRDFAPSDGALLTFARTPADEAWHRRAQEEGFVGHPPHHDWFCDAHAEVARSHTHLPLRDALAAMRATAAPGDPPAPPHTPGD